MKRESTVIREFPNGSTITFDVEFPREDQYVSIENKETENKRLKKLSSNNPQK